MVWPKPVAMGQRRKESSGHAGLNWQDVLSGNHEGGGAAGFQFG
jgi:hypothetical protein